MANTLPNKITAVQAKTEADDTYSKYSQLAEVYDKIRDVSEGGDYTTTYNVANGDADEVDFISGELIADGYTVSAAANTITITWGEAPPH